MRRSFPQSFCRCLSVRGKNGNVTDRNFFAPHCIYFKWTNTLVGKKLQHCLMKVRAVKIKHTIILSSFNNVCCCARSAIKRKSHWRGPQKCYLLSKNIDSREKPILLKINFPRNWIFNCCIEIFGGNRSLLHGNPFVLMPQRSNLEGWFKLTFLYYHCFIISNETLNIQLEPPHSKPVLQIQSLHLPYSLDW